MKKIICMLSVLFAISVICASPTSAAVYSLNMTTIPGYAGKIGIQRPGDDMPYKGDTEELWLKSTKNEDLSKLRVSWSAANPNQVKIVNKGYSKNRRQFEADVTYFRNGVTEPIYATVNGTKLKVNRLVAPNTDNIYSYTDNAGKRIYNDSDTFGKFTVPQGESYTFKIMSSSKPNLVAGSKAFRYVSTVASGQNYFIEFIAIGNPWDECGFYLNGGNLPIAVARIMAGTPYSDTTGLVKVKKNKTYQFMITCTSVPNFTIGSPCFKLVGYTHSGNQYFYKVKAVGKIGQASGVYLVKSLKPEAILKIV